jgi:indolepyruvate ferredoxin oxidoreductase
VHTFPATRLATQVFGDAIAANMIMLGYALQRGWLPLSLEAIERAIHINAVAVKSNLAALELGRRAALDLDAVLRQSTPTQAVSFVKRSSLSLDTLIERRKADLSSYQDAAYAARYEALVHKVRQAESRAKPGVETLTRTVAEQAFRVMAYKDEYEVARLYTDGRFEEKLRAQFDGAPRLTFHLAPPLLSRRDPVTGHLKKRAFGAWVLPMFRILSKLKVLRASPLDPFGWTAERKQEAELARMYPAMIEALLPGLDAGNHRTALTLAGIGADIRGFGHVKERNLLLAAQRWQQTSRGTAAEAVVAGFINTLPQTPTPIPVT